MGAKHRGMKQDRESQFRLKQRREARKIIENREIDESVIYLYTPELENEHE